MATMFIQLRRVVFLLVLFQCCACVVSEGAQTEVVGRGRGNDDATRETEKDMVDEKAVLEAESKEKVVNVNYTDDEIRNDKEIDDDLKPTVRSTMLRIRDSQVPFANATACKTIWEKAIAANNETVKKSREAVEKIKKLGERVDVFLEKRPKMGNKLFLKKDVKAAEFKVLIDEVNAELKERKNDIPSEDTVSTIDGAVYTGHVCLTVRGNAEDALKNLKTSLEGYAGFDGETEKSKKAKEVKRAGEGRRAALEVVLKDLGIVELEATRSVSKAKEQVKVWADAIGKFALVAGGIKGMVEGVSEGEEIQRENNKAIEEIKRAFDEDRVTGIRELVNEDQTARGRREKMSIIENVKEKVEKANVQQTERVERDVREAIEARKKAEEEAAKKAEEDRKKAAEEEKAKRVREEEDAKRKKAVAEEKVKRAREEEDAGRKKVQEEKVMEEKIRRDAEETAKKKDGSLGPSLMHSPLLLLLFCVLGYTLVC